MSHLATGCLEQGKDMAVLHMPLGGFYTSLGQKIELELAPAGRGEIHSSLGRRRESPTAPRYADTAVGYICGPGETIEMGQRVRELELAARDMTGLGLGS